MAGTATRVPSRTQSDPAQTKSRRAQPDVPTDAPLDAGTREEMIRAAAYYRAERRGFQAGQEMDDWLAAERELDSWLATRAAPRRYGR